MEKNNWLTVTSWPLNVKWERTGRTFQELEQE